MQPVSIPSFGGTGTVGGVATNYPFAPNVDVQNAVSAAAAVVASSGTINTVGVSVARVNPAGAVTGVIVQPGTISGQQVLIVNESANSVTMAASGTSNVASGTGAVVAANASSLLVWDAATSLWYKVG